MSSINTFQSEYNTVTLLGLKNQFRALAGLTVSGDLAPFTINTKRGIQPAVVPTKHPTMKYFGIGINGKYNLSGTTPAVSQPRNPKATNMDMYYPIPFRCIPVVDGDLSAQERSLYRIRTIETINGVAYFCYWLKPFTIIDGEEKTVIVDGETGGESDYPLNADNLVPVPEEIATGDVIGVQDSITVGVTADCVVYGNEVLEYINAYFSGNTLFANISEFAFYTGEDKLVEGNDGAGGTVNYTEAIGVHMAVHRCNMGTDLSSSETTHNERFAFENANIINI